MRRSVAAGLHEVGLLLGEERSATHLKGPFLRLCADESIQVVEMIIANLDVLLMIFQVANEDDRARLYLEIAPALLQLEVVIGLEHQIVRGNETQHHHAALFVLRRISTFSTPNLNLNPHRYCR